MDLSVYITLVMMGIDITFNLLFTFTVETGKNSQLRHSIYQQCGICCGPIETDNTVKTIWVSRRRRRGRHDRLGTIQFFLPLEMENILSVPTW